ncbi:Cyclic AMP-dependent protein kinase regulatory subunit (Isoform a) [Dirofilaria immitis]|nr:Cyclic AMP-dependent protein kinase regulatory subunit (Isoform a) [Dirofilaria immitis]
MGKTTEFMKTQRREDVHEYFLAVDIYRACSRGNIDYVVMRDQVYFEYGIRGNSEEAQLAQCQAYVQRHNIQQLVKEAIVSLCINKPENPILFLKEHFEKLYDQRSQACSLMFYIKSWSEKEQSETAVDGRGELEVCVFRKRRTGIERDDDWEGNKCCIDRCIVYSCAVLAAFATALLASVPMHARKHIDNDCSSDAENVHEGPSVGTFLVAHLWLM